MTLIWASVRQPVLAHGSVVQRAETLEHRVWHLGAGAEAGRRGVLWPQRRAACVHLGTYTCPLRVRLARARWLSTLI